MDVRAPCATMIWRLVVVNSHVSNWKAKISNVSVFNTFELYLVARVTRGFNSFLFHMHTASGYQDHITPDWWSMSVEGIKVSMGTFILHPCCLSLLKKKLTVLLLTTKFTKVSLIVTTGDIWSIFTCFCLKHVKNITFFSFIVLTIKAIKLSWIAFTRHFNLRFTWSATCKTRVNIVTNSTRKTELDCVTKISQEQFLFASLCLSTMQHWRNTIQSHFMSKKSRGSSNERWRGLCIQKKISYFSLKCIQ